MLRTPGKTWQPLPFFHLCPWSKFPSEIHPPKGFLSSALDIHVHLVFSFIIIYLLTTPMRSQAALIRAEIAGAVMEAYGEHH